MIRFVEQEAARGAGRRRRRDGLVVAGVSANSTYKGERFAATAGRLDWRAYARVQRALSEVVRYVGSPGDYRTRPTTSPNSDVICVDNDGRAVMSTCARWEGDTIVVHAWMTDDGVVTHLQHEDVRPITQGPIESAIWRLKRQWRRWFPE
jgi:hypothetical protein